MNDPIEILVREHRLIESVLDALEGYGARAAAGEALPPEDLRALTEFFIGFADAHHHAKEEDILFDAMVAGGFPKEGGPIAVMLHEHDIGRGLVSRLAGLAELASWTDKDRTEILSAGTSFATMLRSHIMKEDNILYPMSRQHLSAAAFGEVTAKVAEVERTRGAEADRLRALASTLVEKYAR